MLEFLKANKAKSNVAEVCQVRIDMKTGTVISMITVEDFLVTASTKEEMDYFHNEMKTKYNIKRLGRPTRYLGGHFHHHPDGRIALRKRLLIDKTLEEANMLQANGKSTPYPYGEEYHPPDGEDKKQPDTEHRYKQLAGNLRYLDDCMRQDIAYVTGRLGAAMSKPTMRHWRIAKSTLRYLSHTCKDDLHFRKTKTQGE